MSIATSRSNVVAFPLRGRGSPGAGSALSLAAGQLEAIRSTIMLLEDRIETDPTIAASVREAGRRAVRKMRADVVRIGMCIDAVRSEQSSPDYPPTTDAL